MLVQPQLPDMATQEIINRKARCYVFWMIAGMMMADTSGGYLKLMYLPMLEEVNEIGYYSWDRCNLSPLQIHSMVDEVKSLGDMLSYENLCMFRKLVRNQGSDCLRYVHEVDMIHVSVDYRRDEVQPN
ncbi:hypothetical protein CQW23_12125 [Capsicum baccatum]|uniref:Uncharacterized protein n=1 Tax=Capsicum baccatum TaxID=33114 RepID=A0A2G2WRQ6_CAPBA|nr:hypothetical protein CQW23_12125 [Capsicum baccatum]